MELSKQLPLQKCNSFNVKATCPLAYFPKSISDLKELPDLSQIPFYILGDGSNTLFVDELSPVIIKPQFTGIEISETSKYYTVVVGASENWHDFVCYCIDSGIFGLENLALIPGSVGAAPVQNIGAYGVELSKYCSHVNWFEFSSKTVKTLTNQECNFAYRNSIFKQDLYNKGIITAVIFSFPKIWQPNLSYAGLNNLKGTPTPIEIMQAVIKLRQAKLPDPRVIPNAGSFFKNPTVDEGKLDVLKRTYPKIPFYPQENGQYKLAAGWLIDQVGLRGFTHKGVGVHQHQALVLVNYENEQGAELVLLAKYVQEKVNSIFDVELSPEVRMVTQYGEKDFRDLPQLKENT